MAEDMYLSLMGKDCEITIEPSPAYCDRGNFIAKVWPRGAFVLEIDEADGWPRYYFDQRRAVEECKAWLEKRRQSLDKSPVRVRDSEA